MKISVYSKVALFILLLFVLSCKKEQRWQLTRASLDPKVQQLKAQYEKASPAQRLDLPLNWNAVKWQAEGRDWTSVPIDEQLEMLAVAPENGLFFYRKTLRAKERRLQDNVFTLIYSTEGFLQSVIHAHDGQSDLYLLKATTGNSGAHHIRSKAEKYNSWEAFDFEDFEWVDQQQLLDEFYHLAATPVARWVTPCIQAQSALLGKYPDGPNSIAGDKEIEQKICEYYRDAINILAPCGSDHPVVQIFMSRVQEDCRDFPDPQPAKKVPCPGDPFMDLEIASSGSSGLKGGKYGKGNRKDDKGKPKNHNGIDLRKPVNSSFVAMFSGQVKEAGYLIKDPKKEECYIDPQDGICKGDFGNYIKVKSTVNGKEIIVLYGHLNKIDVKKDQWVSQGQQLGLTGKTGNASSNSKIIPHLHVEVREKQGKNFVLVDPEKYLKTQFDADGKRVPGTGDCIK